MLKWYEMMRLKLAIQTSKPKLTEASFHRESTADAFYHWNPTVETQKCFCVPAPLRQVNLIDPNVLFWRPAEEILPAIVGAALNSEITFNFLLQHACTMLGTHGSLHFFTGNHFQFPKVGMGLIRAPQNWMVNRRYMIISSVWSDTKWPLCCLRPCASTVAEMPSPEGGRANADQQPAREAVLSRAWPETSNGCLGKQHTTCLCMFMW